MVQGRLEFEKLARDCDLDLRLPAVSGRLHGLFDLQVSLNESIALQDPRIARRERIVRIMQHGAIHLSDSARVSLDRLERNVAGFEKLDINSHKKNKIIKEKPLTKLKYFLVSIPNCSFC